MNGVRCLVARTLGPRSPPGRGRAAYAAYRVTAETYAIGSPGPPPPSPAAETPREHRSSTSERPVDEDDATRRAAVEEATQQLQKALRVWSDVEQKKAVLKASQGSRPSLNRTSAAGDLPSPSPSPSPSPPPPPPPPPVGEAEPAAVTPGTLAGGSMAWIGNKRAKFWGVIYPASVPPEKASTASSSPEPPPHVPGEVIDLGPDRPPPGSTDATSSTLDERQTKAVDVTPHAVAASVDIPPSGGRAEERGTPTASPPRAPFAATGGQARLPLRNRYKREVAHRLAEVLNRDAEFGPTFLDALSPESRRLLLVMGTASEYFGSDYQDVVEQVKEADSDKDSSISSKEYEAWASASFHRRRQAHAPPTRGPEEGSMEAVKGMETGSREAPPTLSPLPPTQGGASAGSSSIVQAIQQAWPTPSSSSSVSGGGDSGTVTPTDTTGTHENASTLARLLHLERSEEAARAEKTGLGTTPTPGPSVSPAYIPWRTYGQLLIASAAPFLAFGALDNSTLILAGDMINRLVSESFGLSELVAAALGGVVSGVAGIQVHGLAERWTRAAPPVLTPAQRSSPDYGRASHLGNTLGMVAGLVIGMLPLLFLRSSGDDEAAADGELHPHGERKEQ